MFKLMRSLGRQTFPDNAGFRRKIRETALRYDTELRDGATLSLDVNVTALSGRTLAAKYGQALAAPSGRMLQTRFSSAQPRTRSGWSHRTDVHISVVPIIKNEAAI